MPRVVSNERRASGKKNASSPPSARSRRDATRPRVLPRALLPPSLSLHPFPMSSSKPSRRVQFDPALDDSSADDSSDDDAGPPRSSDPLDDGKGRYESWEDFWRRTSALNAKKAREAGGDPNSEPSAATPALGRHGRPLDRGVPEGPIRCFGCDAPCSTKGSAASARDLQAPFVTSVRHVGARVLVRAACYRDKYAEHAKRHGPSAAPRRDSTGEATRSSPRRATARSGTRRDSRERQSRTARRCSESRRGETGGTAARAVGPPPARRPETRGRRASSPVPVRPEKTSSSDDASSRRRK